MLTNLLAFHSIHPFTRVCLGPACHKQVHADLNALRDRELVEELSYPITVFTHEFGGVPGYTTSQYCLSGWNKSVRNVRSADIIFQDVILDITPTTMSIEMRILKQCIGHTILVSASSCTPHNIFLSRKTYVSYLQT